MSDQRYDEGQLPWLQAVEDEDEPRGVSARKMLAALLVVLLAAALVAATFFWIGRRDAQMTGPPELIEAPAGPYKVKPPNPGGLDVAGENETKEPLPAEPSPAPKPAVPPGIVIQLGAFQNTAQAERAWAALKTRFPTVGAMNKLIIPFPGGIRLRASAGTSAEAKQACQALKAAGENCFVAQ